MLRFDGRVIVRSRVIVVSMVRGLDAFFNEDIAPQLFQQVFLWHRGENYIKRDNIYIYETHKRWDIKWKRLIITIIRNGFLPAEWAK